MRKVFHFDSPREQYVCDAAVVCCYDNRFHTGFAKFLKRMGLVMIDVIKIAGGAKALATPNRPDERYFVLDQIRKSMRLHATKRVILMVHSDCGAYGGIGAFGGDAGLEARRQSLELQRAMECLRVEIPEIASEAYFMDFEGVWQVEPAAISMASSVGSSDVDAG
ncbi:MAG TPA: carbonic anhydrase [Bryobacteraceae bacterium]|jgi:hypothetical protein|nr:carbonic anhydrase [Bryobacteraceae bacterium]